MIGVMENSYEYACEGSYLAVRRFKLVGERGGQVGSLVHVACDSNIRNP